MSEMHWYPVSCSLGEDSGEDSVLLKQLSDLSRDCKWSEITKLLQDEENLDIIKYTGTLNVNCFDKESSPPEFFTVFHRVISNKAPKEIVQTFLDHGASKSLRTSDGETAFDIGKRVGIDDEILEKLSFSHKSSTNESVEVIQKMEEALHQLMRKRVQGLLDKYKVHLPQLMFMYEFGRFHFEVPGWLGGFNPEKHDDGLLVDSFCRVCGGSEQTHVIDRNGGRKLVAEGEDYYERQRHSNESD